jgi:fatty acid desaturase
MKRNNLIKLQEVQWRDLVPLSIWERMWELSLPLPWLFLSLCCYLRGWWEAGLLCSFFLFLTGLRLSHNAQHSSLGLSRFQHDGVLFTLSLIMLASMHAVRVSHLHHHRVCLSDEDAEGSTARLPWWQAFAAGPLFALRLHRSAWRLADLSHRRWIAVELGSMFLLIGFALSDCLGQTLRWHFAAMLAGECFTGFFAVWTVHHGCAQGEAGRTQRGRWLNRISYSMFLHAEHHLFPAVPTIHLWRLAERLDQICPAVMTRQVIAHRLKGSVI